MQQTSAGDGDPEFEVEAFTALQHLFYTAPMAGVLRYQAKAILVFRNIHKAGFVVGVQGGKGVMFGPDGKVLGY
jgi:lipid-binding SYLF domain-containing protein